MKRIKVVVIGAGVGGLSAAVALSDAGFDVEVYDRTSKFRSIGAGICMWPNGARALHALGLGDAAAKISPVLDRVEYRDRHGQIRCEIPIAPLVVRCGVRPYPLARPDLQAALLARLSRGQVILGAECLSVEAEGNQVAAVFRNGSRVSADLLVGADGLRSVIRRYVVGDLTLRYVYSTCVGSIGVDPNLNPPNVFTMYADEAKRVGVQPISGGRFYIFFDAPIGTQFGHGTGGVGELGSLFADWTETVSSLIRLVGARAQRLQIADLDPLPSFVRGRVVLLGDSAHPSTPTLGQGGALAIEDSLVLAHHLRSGIPIEEALGCYDFERRKRTAPVVLAARRRTNVMLGGIPSETDEWYKRLGSGQRDFLDTMERLVAEGPLDADFRVA